MTKTLSSNHSGKEMSTSPQANLYEWSGNPKVDPFPLQRQRDLLYTPEGTLHRLQQPYVVNIETAKRASIQAINEQRRRSLPNINGKQSTARFARCLAETLSGDIDTSSSPRRSRNNENESSLRVSFTDATRSSPAYRSYHAQLREP